MNKEDVLKNSLLYLAGPYSSQYKKVMENRAKKHCKIAGALRRLGYCVYSPIAETCNIAKYSGVGGTWEDWRGHDLRLLAASDQMVVFMLEGWNKSRGVRGEIKFCLNNNIPIKLLDSKEEIMFEITKDSLLRELGVKSIDELND